MIDWLSDHAWVTWLGIAVLLAVVELMSLDLVLLMFALGALGAAVVAGFGGPLWLAILVFVVVSLGLLFLVRPPLVQRLHAGPTLKTGHENLVGRDAVVVEPVGRESGRVRLASELWSARADGGETFDTGAEVHVIRIDGATAVVTRKES
ncbi:NfeD family protein [Aeromicrobium sp.]|uniref:NfeD family protein n=1 Tax=Aeromicrobium sp. TaxID=1871063 RepID=UPI003D6BA179